MGDDFPTAHADERDLFVDWLDFLRGAVLRKLDGITDEQARWRPDGKLISLLGIANHLAHVEWRWIEGGMRGVPISREESEFHPGAELTIADARTAYLSQAKSTNGAIYEFALDAPCARGDNVDFRWVLVHLVNETARHAGHADAVRELLDGTTGE
jgi:hypothetical protein